MSKEEKSYLSLGEKVFYQIRDDIVSGKILEGQKLIETQLAQRLEVSRTPVREALRRLEKEGFIEVTPHVGAYIKVITKKDIEEYLEVRDALEKKAIQLACARQNIECIKKLESVQKKLKKVIDSNRIERMAQLDEEFHKYIFLATENDLLYRTFNTIKDQMFRYRVMYLKNETKREKIVKEHDLILQSIKNQNTQEAIRYVDSHIKNQKEKMKLDEIS